jgi:hypothetical protein
MKSPQRSPSRERPCSATIGNSGQSDAPHLHFHVVDGRDPLASEGIPVVFDSFGHDGVIHRDEMPVGGWVVDFKPLTK